MREERPARRTHPVLPGLPSTGRRTEVGSDFPVFAVREWAARFYEQERLKREATWWRLAWPFAAALALAVGAAAATRLWPSSASELARGTAVILAAAAFGVTAGGVLRWRATRRRQSVAAARPATVENIPLAARAAVLDSPRLRFRRPTDGPSFAAVRDGVAAVAPMGEFAASVLVWALVMRDRVDGTLEDWVVGRRT
jgi:hypothetical protein